MLKKSFSGILIFTALLLACDKNDNFVLFSPADDVALGMQVSKEIAADPNFELLSESTYSNAYAYLNGLVNEILATGEVAYRDEFVWDVTIVRNDTVLNAFAAPGGYIYLYTGLIKYLQTADALAGVLGHEIAHADLRHSSRNLQKQYGVAILLGLLTGSNPSQLEVIVAQIAGTLAGLQFSREFETEADLRSVEYLARTNYACDGAKLFFERLEEAGQGSGPLPQFLSTHPNPENRIENIEEQARMVNCSTALSNHSDYAGFKSSLPD